MIEFKCEITDMHNVQVALGDYVRVHLPATKSRHWSGDCNVPVAEKDIIAEVCMNLSRGLQIRVLDVQYRDEKPKYETPLRIGAVIKFKHRAWKWEVVVACNCNKFTPAIKITRQPNQSISSGYCTCGGYLSW